MILAIPASKNKPDARVDERFARCACFCLYDTATRHTEFRENELKDESGGVGPQVVEFLVSCGVGKVCAVEIGPKAQDMLDRLQIETEILTGNQTVREIIDLHTNKK